MTRPSPPGRAAASGDEAFRVADGFRVADAGTLDRVLDRMAAYVDGTVEGGLALIGIRRRGVPLAETLAERVKRSGRTRVLGGEIELKRYADDLTLLHEDPLLLDVELPERLERLTVVLVDDVLYSGRTLLRAARSLVEAGAGIVRCAVLCSRGANEVPIAADFVGLQLDVGPDVIVEVRVPPYEEELAVVLRRRAAARVSESGS